MPSILGATFGPRVCARKVEHDSQVQPADAIPDAGDIRGTGQISAAGSNCLARCSHNRQDMRAVGRVHEPALPDWLQADQQW